MNLGPWLSDSALVEYEACLDTCPLPDVFVSLREVTFPTWITIAALLMVSLAKLVVPIRVLA